MTGHLWNTKSGNSGKAPDFSSPTLTGEEKSERTGHLLTANAEDVRTDFHPPGLALSPNTRVRHIGPDNPELAGRVGTVQLEPVETAGVVCVLWDGSERVCWIRTGEVEACE